MQISTIIVNYNGLALCCAAIDSLVQHCPESEIIVVDNGSKDGSIQALAAKYPAIRLIALDANRGFGSANNAGARKANGDLLFFLNNDTQLQENTAHVLSHHFGKDMQVGACGPRLMNADGSFQLSSGLDPSLINEWKTRREQQRVERRNLRGSYPHSIPDQIAEVDWVTGAALMVRKDIFERIGGFDEQYFMYFEDVDLCKKIREEGWKVLYDPASAITHLKGSSGTLLRGKVGLEYRKSQILYYRRYRSLVSSVLLRSYLFVKYCMRWIMSNASSHAKEEKSSVASLFKILIR